MRFSEGKESEENLGHMYKLIRTMVVICYSHLAFPDINMLNFSF
jgi:hypothetical protein